MNPDGPDKQQNARESSGEADRGFPSSPPAPEGISTPRPPANGSKTRVRRNKKKSEAEQNETLPPTLEDAAAAAELSPDDAPGKSEDEKQNADGNGAAATPAVLPKPKTSPRATGRKAVAAPARGNSKTPSDSPPQQAGQPKKKAESKPQLSADDKLRNLSLTKKLEREAWMYHQQLSEKIKKDKGSYLRDEVGDCHLLLGGKRIPLNYERNNHELNSLLLRSCDITLHAPAAKSTSGRLIHDARNAAGKFKLREFSAMSKDGTRLYVPLKDPSTLLQITADGIKAAAEELPDLMMRWTEHVDDETGLPLDARVAVDSLALHGQCAVPGGLFYLPSTSPVPDADGNTIVPESLAGQTWECPPDRPNGREVLIPWRKDWGIPGWQIIDGAKVWLVRPE